MNFCHTTYISFKTKFCYCFYLFAVVSGLCRTSRRSKCAFDVSVARPLSCRSGQTSLVSLIFGLSRFIWSAPSHQKQSIQSSSDTVSDGFACLTFISECVQSFICFLSSSSFPVSVHKQLCLVNSTCTGTSVWSAVIILEGGDPWRRHLWHVQPVNALYYPQLNSLLSRK